jgi:demethylmenaquinone methyltransferase/2-methoxy-6-polyprenyl-1,4-benzoquinol methylase
LRQALRDFIGAPLASARTIRYGRAACRKSGVQVMTQARTGAEGGMETSYGFRDVGAGEKQGLVNDVFHKVAKRYDIMNDLMSAGMHRAWKDAMIAALNPRKSPDYRVLDVAGGTGDIAFRIVEASNRLSHATVLDINGSMLSVGAERAAKKGLTPNLTFVEANAEELPFPANTFDAYTIAFGIRNVPRIDVALAEAYRVLKRGGRLLVLEFSDVDMPLLDRIYEAWSFNAIPRIGKAVTGDAEPYQYLVESIRKFPNQRNFAAMIAQAGFSRATFTNFTGGIAALHSGWKI